MISPERAIQIEKIVISKGLRLERKDFHQTASGELFLQEMLHNAEDTHGFFSNPLTTRVYDSLFFSVFSAVYKDNVFFGSRLDDLLDTTRPKNRIKNMIIDKGDGALLLTGKKQTSEFLTSINRILSLTGANLWIAVKRIYLLKQ